MSLQIWNNKGCFSPNRDGPFTTQPAPEPCHELVTSQSKKLRTKTGFWHNSAVELTTRWTKTRACKSFPTIRFTLGSSLIPPRTSEKTASSHLCTSTLWRLCPSDLSYMKWIPPLPVFHSSRTSMKQLWIMQSALKMFSSKGKQTEENSTTKGHTWNCKTSEFVEETPVKPLTYILLRATFLRRNLRTGLCFTNHTWIKRESSAMKLKG